MTSGIITGNLLCSLTLGRPHYTLRYRSFYCIGDDNIINLNRNRRLFYTSRLAEDLHC